jgi:hypothetical protein
MPTLRAELFHVNSAEREQQLRKDEPRHYARHKRVDERFGRRKKFPFGEYQIYQRAYNHSNWQRPVLYEFEHVVVFSVSDLLVRLSASLL